MINLIDSVAPAQLARLAASDRVPFHCTYATPRATSRAMHASVKLIHARTLIMEREISNIGRRNEMHRESSKYFVFLGYVINNGLFPYGMKLSSNAIISIFWPFDRPRPPSINLRNNLHSINSLLSNTRVIIINLSKNFRFFLNRQCTML